LEREWVRADSLVLRFNKPHEEHEFRLVIYWNTARRPSSLIGEPTVKAREIGERYVPGKHV
jgi:hypothetical protein